MKSLNVVIWKQRKENQPNGNNHDQSNNLEFKYSNNVTDGVCTQTWDGQYKPTLFNTLNTKGMQLHKT